MSAAPTHVTAKCVWNGAQLVHDDVVRFNGQVRRRLKPGDGETFIVRVEREADAKKHHQLKWYWGFIVKQCYEAETGHTVNDFDEMFRAMFMPGDVATLSLMSYEQMRDFNIQCEEYAARVIGVVVTGPHDAREWVA